MKAFSLRRSSARAVLFGVLAGAALLSIAPPALATGPATLGRTSWQVSRPYAPVRTDSFPSHGNVGFYNFIPAPGVPGATDASWSSCGPASPICPSADTIGMAQGSRLGPIGYPCLASADFTFFQSLVSIPLGTTITQFTISMSGADDGARAAVYNSQYPAGQVVPGSYITLNGGTGSTSDLSSYVVAGEVNRVVVTQVDDCAVENNLRFAQILLNGNVVPPKPADDVAPVDAPVPTPAANAAGWNNADVTVAWHWTDADSGIDPAKCDQSSSSAGEGAITLSSTCFDLAGNHAADTRTVYIDKTAPSAAPVVTPGANGAGWNNTDISVAWNWTDSGGSGIDPTQCTQASASSGEGTLTLSSTCSDVAGNSSSSSVTVLVDETAPSAAPVVTPAANGAGWNNTDVSVAWNWTDGGSGIDPAQCTQTSTSTGEGALTLTSTCSDRAGNSSTASRTVKVDKTGPTIAYSGNAGSYSIDQTVSITCAVSDALSGTSDTCTGASGPAWSFGAGIHALSASATDNAGNTAGGGTSFTVNVDAAGLCALVRQFVSNAGIANSLCVKLNAAAAAAARGQDKTKANVLGAFDDEVRAQTGKAITPDHAALLRTFAAAL